MHSGTITTRAASATPSSPRRHGDTEANSTSFNKHSELRSSETPCEPQRRNVRKGRKEMQSNQYLNSFAAFANFAPLRFENLRRKTRFALSAFVRAIRCQNSLA